MRKTILDAQDVKNLAPWFKSDTIIKALLRWLNVERVNKLHGDNIHMQGADFTDGILRDLNIDLVIEGEEVLKNLPEGSFVALSNHPFGALDGVTIISLFARYRPEFKVMVNKMLMMISALAPNFIAVQPHSNTEAARKASMNGIREAMQHVRNNNPIGFFPAGAVSKLKGNLTTEDREWQSSIIRLVKQFKKPVVPVYFYGRNTLMFYCLRTITYLLSSLRLPTEVMKKRGTTLRVAVGRPIMPEEYAHIEDIEELGRFFKAQTYNLKKD
ncbi:MAG: 1-acyl-sn-glycerol-3-phosphate acyltransferase [Bacteroidaceae bacterium]|nr:1-acyl-sn-glycerol-3-phosphate acyltransferase [Bacteroidaceae bacterium]